LSASKFGIARKISASIVASAIIIERRALLQCARMLITRTVRRRFLGVGGGAGAGEREENEREAAALKGNDKESPGELKACIGEAKKNEGQGCRTFLHETHENLVLLHGGKVAARIGRERRVPARSYVGPRRVREMTGKTKARVAALFHYYSSCAR
jgi:hypothetical protein